MKFRARHLGLDWIGFWERVIGFWHDKSHLTWSKLSPCHSPSLAAAAAAAAAATLSRRSSLFLFVFSPTFMTMRLSSYILRFFSSYALL
jgi:hypothetical protein